MRRVEPLVSSEPLIHCWVSCSCVCVIHLMGSMELLTNVFHCLYQHKVLEEKPKVQNLFLSSSDWEINHRTVAAWHFPRTTGWSGLEGKSWKTLFPYFVVRFDENGNRMSCRRKNQSGWNGSQPCVVTREWCRHEVADIRSAAFACLSYSVHVCVRVEALQNVHLCLINPPWARSHRFQ